jgi:hypothetical protein
VDTCLVGKQKKKKKNMKYITHNTASVVKKAANIIAPVPRSLALVWSRIAFLALLVTALGNMSAWAQTNFPDVSVLYTQPASGFNSALTWSIGATAVLIVVGWIVRAMRRK